MYVSYTSNRNLSSTFDELHGTVLMVQVHLTFYVLTSRKGVKFRCSKSRGKKQKGINCVSLISLLLGTQQKGINCVSLIHKKLYRSPLPDKKGRRPRSKLCFHSYYTITSWASAGASGLKTVFCCHRAWILDDAQSKSRNIMINELLCCPENEWLS